MSLGLQLILSTSLVAAPPGCSWAHPGANPYRGDPARALADFDLPPATREQLRALMHAHRPTDVARITRDDIVGRHGRYGDLRGMHSGHGRVCHGTVDRSAWSAKRHERALVYCAGDACVIVPTICHNVSLVSRKPEHAAADDSPIDIEPAAGPPHAPAGDTPPGTTDQSPFGFVPTPGGGDGVPGAPGVPGGGGPGGGDSAGPPGGPVGGPGDGAGLPPGGGPIGSAPPVQGPPPIGDLPPGDDAPPGNGAPPIVGIPPVDGTPPIGGSLPCCDAGPGLPIGPGSPGASPIAPSVPEAPAWTLLAAGLALVLALRRLAA